MKVTLRRVIIIGLVIRCPKITMQAQARRKNREVTTAGHLKLTVIEGHTERLVKPDIKHTRAATPEKVGKT